MERVCCEKSGFESELISLLVVMGLFLKQFYFGLSGTLQTGDMVLILAALVCVVQKGFEIEEDDKPFFVFIIFVVIINTVHSILEGCIYASSFFWIYNFIILAFLFRPMLQVESFLDNVRLAFRLVLITQLIIYLANMGTYENDRYLGTFNDPNQFGFFIFCSMLGQYAIDVIQKRNINWLWIIIGVFEIVLSESNGMIMGTGVFLISYLWFAGAEGSVYRRLYLFALTAILVLAIYFLFENQILEALKGLNNDVIDRKLPKIAESGLIKSYLEDRRLLRIIREPWYFVLGSGEGNFSRFDPARIYSYPPEMHSTMLALPYYYGIFPFCFMLMWWSNCMRNMNHRLFSVYLALILEAFTLANHRQYVFWLLFMLASHRWAKE